MFTAAGGDRATVPNVVVLLTSKDSRNVQSTLAEVNLAKQRSISFVVITVGSLVNQFEASNIASYPSSSNWIDVMSISMLSANYTRDVLDRVCNSELRNINIISFGVLFKSEMTKRKKESNLTGFGLSVVRCQLKRSYQDYEVITTNALHYMFAMRQCGNVKIYRKKFQMQFSS